MLCRTIHSFIFPIFLQRTGIGTPLHLHSPYLAWVLLTSPPQPTSCSLYSPLDTSAPAALTHTPAGESLPDPSFWSLASPSLRTDPCSPDQPFQTLLSNLTDCSSEPSALFLLCGIFLGSLPSPFLLYLRNSTLMSLP